MLSRFLLKQVTLDSHEHIALMYRERPKELDLFTLARKRDRCPAEGGWRRQRLMSVRETQQQDKR